jgi:ribosomal protein L12E/L44/L45/RPP1/RPP2
VHVPELVVDQPAGAEELVVVASAVGMTAEPAEPEPVAEHIETVSLDQVAEPEVVEAASEEPVTVAVAVAEDSVAEPEATEQSMAIEPAHEAEPVATPKRRAPQNRRARAVEVARGRRFLVEYRVERVLYAVDIHDALRKAATLGAAQLTAITRED